MEKWEYQGHVLEQDFLEAVNRIENHTGKTMDTGSRSLAFYFFQDGAIAAMLRSVKELDAYVPGNAVRNKEDVN